MTAVEQLRECSGELARACDALVRPTPEALDVCSTILEGALRNLVELQPALPAAGPDALAEAWRLRRTVRHAGALLANAAEYHHRWQSLLGVKAAGYGPGGSPGDPPRPGRLCVRG